MQIGRNDPCSCGSGKKYKKCCLNNKVLSKDFTWMKIHKSRNELVGIVMKFAAKNYGENSILEAWDEFNCWKDDLPELDPESYQNQVFMPWFFCDWTPDPENTTVNNKKYHDIPIGRALLDWKGNKLSSLQKEYIEKCLEGHFSFFEILECRKGDGYHLKDLFTLEEFEVIEKSGSQYTEKNDIIFGKAVTLEGVTTLEACSPFAIPPGQKLHIVNLRNHIKKQYPKITGKDLKRYDFEMLDLYQEFHDQIANPEMPRVCNTDGDELIPQKLIFKVRAHASKF